MKITLNPVHRSLLLLSVAFSLSACISLLVPKVEPQLIKLKAGTYSLDKSHASVVFKVKHMGLSYFVGRFNKFDASLDFNPNAIESSSLSAVIDMTSIDINNDDLKLDLERPSWLAIEKYPQAVFETKEVKQHIDSSLVFIGELDWRGVKKQIPMQVVFHGGANNILSGKYTLGFSAKTKFNRSDFGMDAFIPLVGDEILIEAEAEFQRN